MHQSLDSLQASVSQALEHLLEFWCTHSVDQIRGGFIGKMDHQNTVVPDAPKGGVLNARILWTFAAAYRHHPNPDYLQMANRAYQYLDQFFEDKAFGGIYWTVTAAGEPLDTKKQVYAIAFYLYALSEYHRGIPNPVVLKKAIALYRLIEQHSFDRVHTGYLEAFTRNWEPLDDLRLSAKDANEKKTMNTHLHVLEAYTNLYRIWPDAALKQSIQLLLQNFTQHIIGPQHHLQLFFTETWQVKGDVISFGHDIEAAWLLQEAAEVIQDSNWIVATRQTAVQLADAAARGLDADGGLWYEIENGDWMKEKHWWPQAEALVGFFNAWQVSSKPDYLQMVFNNWQYIQQHIMDKEKGEWIWGIGADGLPMPNQDKIGLWKCPYHNGRACLELLHRLSTIKKL